VSRSNEFRDQLYRLLHAEEQNLASNQYDIIRVDRQLERLQIERRNIEHSIETIKAQIDAIKRSGF
jgi:septal ring factor EnvC (AmiA/AmiB activator)